MKRYEGHVTMNTSIQYEIPIFNGWKVMAKVKVFVYATNADVDTDANTRAMKEAPRRPAH